MLVRRRTLEPGELQQAIDAGGPLQEMQIQADKIKEMAIAVVEVMTDATVDPLHSEWRIVAYWVVWYALHTEPLWIAPDYRKHPGVVGGIVEEMQRIVEASGEPSAFCVIEDGDLAETVRGYATRLGFLQAPGTLHYLVLQPAPEPVTR